MQGLRVVRQGVLLLVLWALPFATAEATPVVFTPDYSAEGAGEGFNDPDLGDDRKSAFEYALGVMSGVFESRYANETYKVRAQFNALAGNMDSAVLGSTSPVAYVAGIDNPVESFDRFYPAALASHRHTADLNGGDPEINIQFNSSVDNGTVLGSTNWYYGVDANPEGHIDLITVAMHEIAHGIGFTGFLGQNGAYPMQGGSPVISIFDHFMNTSSTGGAKLTSLNNPQRSAEAIGNDLWWDGAIGTSANGGTRPKLHAPAAFAGGSSLYHLDESTLGAQLLSPFYSGPDHTLSLMERGMLADMGWSVSAIPESGALLMVGAASCLARAGAVLRRRQSTRK